MAADTTRTTLDNCLVGLETGFVGLISGFVESPLYVGGGFISITDVDGRTTLGITFDGSGERNVFDRGRERERDKGETVKIKVR